MGFEGKTAVYIKPSLTHGIGPIPKGAIGKVLIYAESPASKKALIDFHKHGIAIVPFNSVQIEKD